MHGQGRYKWSNENCYEGDWVDDARTGKGKETRFNGDVYVGDWKDNKMLGKEEKK